MVESNAIAAQAVGAKITDEQGIASGLLVALCIISLWAASLSVLLHLKVAELPGWLILPLVLWQMFLYTGLFITAHDAMHGLVYPQNPKLIHWIGSLTVFCYGTFSYLEQNDPALKAELNLASQQKIEGNSDVCA